METPVEQLFARANIGGAASTDSLPEMDAPVELSESEEDDELSREYDTLNFTPITESIEDLFEQGSCLAGMSMQKQEEMLLYDMLYFIKGTQSELIVFSPEKERGSRVTINPYINPSLRDLALQITAIAEHYSEVVTFMENVTLKSGKVNQALAAALREIIMDYMIMVSHVDKELRGKRLTLQALWYYIQPSMKTFACLNAIVTEIMDEKLSGGSILNVLRDKAYSMIADESLTKLCLKLASRAATPYFEMLESWIYKGIIVDPFKEFLVIDTDPNPNQQSDQQRSDKYWDKRYAIDDNKCPKLLKKKTIEILKAGKYLNVIRQTGRNVVVQQAEKIQFSLWERDYVGVIDHAYIFASRSLLNLLLEDFDLMRRLQSVKHYLLIDQGDFIVQFLHDAKDELTMKVDDVNLARIETLLALSIRTSSLAFDPYKDMVGVQVHPFGISDQLSAILQIGTPTEFDKNDALEILSNFNTPCSQAASFTYKVDWPVSLIMNNRAMTCYQMIFRHLFYCKYVERELCKIWIFLKSMKSYKIEKRGTGKIYDLRIKMLHFVQNILYYTTFEIIDQAWASFFEHMSKVTNVDEVLNRHFDLLNSILMDSLLIHRTALAKITDLLSLCLTFTKLVQSCSDLRNESILSDFDGPLTDISKKFHAMMISFLKEVSSVPHGSQSSHSNKVTNVIYRMNFNGFYVEDIDELLNTEIVNSPIL